MKAYTIEIEDTVSELFEEIGAMFEKPAALLMADVLFLRAEETRNEIEKKFMVKL